ncbi:F0F1 ATP synthase subunit delta [Candidatus Saccharibacteria bacterium]|nr:F0F1 ATP synthase subunit delta [Candidatus Saccharibacteria bacterium]
MNKVSRRALAHWAADQLESGKSSGSVAKHLAAVLKQSNMAAQVDFLIRDISWELEQRQALAIGKVTSAHKLSQQLEQALADQIKKATGAKDVVLENEIDKSVIGGVRVETANRVWDATVSKKLSELKEVF